MCFGLLIGTALLSLLGLELIPVYELNIGFSGLSFLNFGFKCFLVYLGFEVVFVQLW